MYTWFSGATRWFKLKIYPSPHKVRVAEVPRYLDIPVAHIEQEYHPQKIVSVLNPDFALEDKQFVGPYRRFSTDNLLFFDNEENLVSPNLRRDGYSYIYEPESAQEFTPEEFMVWALIKRADWMSSKKNYNLRVGIYNQPGAKDFAKTLISIFGDAPYRKISPANVEVNSGSTVVENLLSSDGNGLDWLFVESHDAVVLEGTSANIDISNLMKDNANLWITVENTGAGNLFDMISAGQSYITTMTSFNGTDMVKDSSFATTFDKDYKYSAKAGQTIQSMPASEYRYIMPKASSNRWQETSPIYVIEKPNSGYIVVSSKNMFNHLDKYAKYIYRIMLQLYFKSYKRTPQKNLWITNAPVGYMGSLKSPFRRTHPIVNLDKLVHQVDKNIVSYELKSVMFDVNDILYVNMDGNRNMNFKKMAYTDPALDGNYVSVYTSKKTVAMYKDEPIRLIESSVIITPEITEDEQCYITVAPFKSSKYRLISSTDKRFRIRHVNEEYVLYALPYTGEDSVVDLLPAKEFDPDAAIELARIKVKFVGEASSYDVRLLGGGLPEGYTNYEMFDISNIKGRPYRVGTGAIVYLPPEYKEHDKMIKEAIDKHKVAGNKIYIVYGKLEDA